MEQGLDNYHKKTRDEGKTIKRWWFNCRAKQLAKEHYPDENFKVFDQWFLRFTNSFDISLRRKKNALCTKRSTSFELFNRKASFKRVAYRKTWNIPDERPHKHGGDTTVLCDGRCESVY